MLPFTGRSTVAASPLAADVDPGSRSFRDIGRALVDSPRWLLLAALVFAPWAYGATRPWARNWLAGLLLAAVLFWVLECLARRRRPAVPWLAAGAAGVLLLQGWAMALNARSAFEAQLGMLLPLAAPAPGWPGSVSGPHSIETMWWMTALLGAFLFCCDLASRRTWRRRLWLTLALVGTSIAAFGIVQKIGGEPVLAWIWEPEKRDLANNFAAYRNRNNAGAFLNLVLPLVAGLVVVAFQGTSRSRERRPERTASARRQPDAGERAEREFGDLPPGTAHWRKAGWAAALFLVAAGIQLNPSRAGWGIALLMSAVFGARLLWQWWRHEGRDVPLKQLLPGGAVVALLIGGLAGIVLLGRWESSWRRFGVQGIDLAQRSPTEIYLKMTRDAGALGFGPGTFEAAFPGYQRSHDFGARAVPESWTHYLWPHAHQDYLQTVIEWGWLGAVLWGLLVCGALARGFRRCLGAPGDASRHWLLFGCVLAVAGALLHALVDFPLQIASIQLYFGVILAFCWSAD